MSNKINSVKNFNAEIAKTKCAEIFCLVSHLEIKCTFCLKDFQQVYEFCNHLVEEHLNIQDPEFMELFLEPEKRTIGQRNIIEITTADANFLKNAEIPEEYPFEINESGKRSKNFPPKEAESLLQRPKLNPTQEEPIKIILDCDDISPAIKLNDTISLDTEISELYEAVVNDLKEIEDKNFSPNQTQKPYKCENKGCNKSFANQNSLKAHLRYHEERPFKCSLCPLGFVFKSKFKAHVMRHYKNETEKPKLELDSKENRAKRKRKSSKELIQPKIKDLNSTNEKIEKCKRKGPKEKETMKIKPDKSKRNSFRVICNVCGKLVPKYTMNHHLKKHDDSRYKFKCNICKKMFIFQKSLKNHIKIRHTKELTFVCDWKDCGKKFVDQVSLKAHLSRHTCDKPYKCQVCSKSFIFECRRDHHYKIYHVNGRIYKCEICSKSFYEQHDLNKHKIIHSNERPYACDQCPAKFSRERCLLWHKKQHSGVKDFFCKICGKGYALYNGIYSHMKTHGIKYSKDYEKGITDGKS